MARVTASKESLEGAAPLPDGLYEVRLEGFKPKMSKAGTSVNLNPEIKVVNNAQYNGRPVFDNLNTGAGWILESFSHCFGQELLKLPDGSAEMPGFNGPDDAPDQWTYQGPLTGSVGKVFLKNVEYNGKTNAKIDQYVCNVPGCNTKHARGLAK